MARKMAKQAIVLMDKGNFQESIKLLEKAHELDSSVIDYEYEIGYAYYLKKEFDKAVKILSKISEKKGLHDQFFQLLGSCYDYLGDFQKAISIYEKGLKNFPSSGALWGEIGVTLLRQKELAKALSYFEKGIEVAPLHASNYYWASKIYFSSSKEVWGIIYGELFMNLERNSVRTSEISRLIYSSFKRNILLKEGHLAEITFTTPSLKPEIYENDLQHDGRKFEIKVFAQGLMEVMDKVNEINIESLSVIREDFIKGYFSKQLNTDYPNALFNFQKKVMDAGFSKAYSYWILRSGDPEKASKWVEQNRNYWSNFIKWFGQNKLQITQSDTFRRQQNQ